jgi:hypothetical protein
VVNFNALYGFHNFAVHQQRYATTPSAGLTVCVSLVMQPPSVPGNGIKVRIVNQTRLSVYDDSFHGNNLRHTFAIRENKLCRKFWNN